jgi:hypothetical protein
LNGGVAFSLCLLALAAVFVIRALRIRAQRRREHARERAELSRTDGLARQRAPGGYWP